MKARFAAALLVLSCAGCGSPIVGADCARGFTECGGACVDTSADFRNCGGCGNDCGLFECVNGACTTMLRADAGTGLPDAGAADASDDDAGALDASVVDAGPPEPPFTADAGLPGCDVGERDCGGRCVEPASDPDHCGGCGNQCVTPDVCAAGTCASACTPPLLLCADRCLSVVDDPRHCGDCNTRCASGICEDRVCADAIAGHVVVLGHNFGSSNPAMRRIAGNAVFLGRGAPVRVLVYRGEAGEGSVTGVEAAIDQTGSEIGRAWQRTEAIETIVALQLQQADVFLVHAQSRARKSTLMKLGSNWGNALRRFLLSGGVIVLFEEPSATNDGTYRVLEPAEIFAAAKRESIAKQELKVVTPGIGVALRVPARYVGEADSVRFLTVTTPATTVVVDKDGAAVVLHRIIVP